MPELPEVETIRRDLSKTIVGRTITKAKAYDEKILVDIGKRTFARRLKGKTITSLRRQGKVLIIELSSGLCLLVHLRMTGRLYTVSSDEALPRHTRATLHLDNGQRLVFVNPRRLGRLEMGVSSQSGACCLLANTGMDALSPELNEDLIEELLRSHSIPIKKFLLNQRYIAGIGNIYASEILFRSRIHPGRPANSLRASERRKLLKTIRRVLEEAIKHGGTTVRDYRTGEGREGAYQHKLRVYGREGKRCTRRGCRATVVRMKHAGRSTYFCPECQR